MEKGRKLLRLGSSDPSSLWLGLVHAALAEILGRKNSKYFEQWFVEIHGALFGSKEKGAQNCPR